MPNVTINHIATVFPIDAEALKPEPNFHRRRSIIREFSLHTSTHGIPGIARSQTIHNRIFWSLSFLLFTGIMLYFVTGAVMAYFQYSTQTSVNFIQGWPQAFPAVTICNYSPFVYDRFIGSYLNYTNALNLTNVTDPSTFSKIHSVYVSYYMQYELNRNQSLNQFFYPLESLLMTCVYNGVNCSAADFVQFTSPVYGSCYTFNAQANSINNGEIHYNNENGDSGQLQLDLYVHSDQYVPYLSDGVSIVTMVHDNTQLPLIDVVSIQLAPGRKHKLGYSLKTNSFLSKPYTTCSDTITTGMQAMFDQFSGAKYAYGQEICYKVAIQTYVYEECGCVSPFEWSARYIVPLGTKNVIYALLCNVSDPFYSDATTTFQSTDYLWQKYASDCGLECSSNEFVLTLFSILAPPKWYMDDVKHFVESSSISLPINRSITWPSDIQNNYVGINVVCETTRIEAYTQQATLGVVDVISNVGGQTGLWIGISFLSLLEVVEMVYRFSRYHLYASRRKIQERKAKQRMEKY